MANAPPFFCCNRLQKVLGSGLDTGGAQPRLLETRTAKQSFRVKGRLVFEQCLY